MVRILVVAEMIIRRVGGFVTICAGCGDFVTICAGCGGFVAFALFNSSTIRITQFACAETVVASREQFPKRSLEIGSKSLSLKQGH
jgi:hypothetical protein